MIATDLCRIDFEPVGKRFDVPIGTSLLDAALRAGIGVASICGGEGTCGRCRVVVMDGVVSPPQAADREFLSQLELEAGERLACRAHARGDVKVAIPKASLAADQRLQVGGLATAVVVEAAVRAYAVESAPPSLRDLRSDLDRVGRALETAHGQKRIEAGPEVIRQLSPLARRTDWHLTAYLRGRRMVGVAEPGRPPVGFAADLGTTKIAGYLVDLETGEELAASGVMNPQIGYGEDVISRLAYAAHRPDGALELGRVVRRALDGLAGSLADEAGVDREQIVDACVVGNTAMHHLFLGLPTRQLAVAPFVAAASGSMDVRARDLELGFAPGASVHVPPCVGGFVGADHVAMIMAAGLDRGDRVAVGVDIGTNTEIALCKPGADHLTSASCASGPAFEGAHIRDGMRAATGAIEAVRLSADLVEVTTIGGAPAVGICGSGIVDAIAELRRTERINERGRFQRDAPGVREGDRGLEFVLVRASRSGTGRDIVVSQGDVNEIQLAKGAIAAGVEILLEMTGTPRDSVEELIVAGAFGSYLDLDSALAIGLLPRLPRASLRRVGNAAGAGAKAALVSLRERAHASRIAQRTGYLELTAHPGFQRRFARSMLFPASVPGGR
jgi:uncharacterized 2Fe-2S/4Fe-4S cluster protein (DUF4445 family)